MNADTAAVYQGLFERLKTVLFADDFKARHRRHEKDFTRQRCLTFTVVVIFLLNLVKRALQDELDEFFKLLHEEPVAVRVVTKSAFSQARQKLHYAAFVELNQEQVTYFYDHFAPHTWWGFRLVAIDGSTSELPRTLAIMDHFGAWHPAQGAPCPVARVSQLFDVLNEVTLDARIAPKAVGERALAAQHIVHLQAGDLVLVDRGYPAFWLFALIRAQNAHFCARMKLSGWHVVERFVAAGLAEQIVPLLPCPAARKECRARQLPITPLMVRLIRVELDNGEIEVLMTSLVDTQRYPIAAFQELYHHRWPVEESYKVWKSRLEIENWSGQSVLAVYQDFHAKVFTTNLTAILAHPAQAVVQQKSQGKKYRYRINMANAVSKMKDTVVLLLQRTAILPLLHRLWQVITQTVEPVRPGRSYPRKKRVKRRRFPVAYKPLR
jgi:hypothetical protein